MFALLGYQLYKLRLCFRCVAIRSSFGNSIHHAIHNSSRPGVFYKRPGANAFETKFNN